MNLLTSCSFRQLFNKQLLRFFLVSISNTLSFILVLVFLKYIGVGDVLANFFGYLVANVQSYLLNKVWTFENKGDIKTTFLQYLCVIFVAYTMNLLTLLLALNYFQFSSYISHGIAVLTYGAVAFLGMRYLVFKENI